MNAPDDDMPAPSGLTPRLVRTARGFVRAKRLDTAATLTFYGLLSIFPAMLALVALAGVVGQGPEVADRLLDLIEEVGPPGASETFRGTVEGAVSGAGAPAVMTLGFVGALWAATGWIDAFSRAADGIRGTAERLPYVQRKARQLAMAVALAIGLIVLSTMLVVSGPVARRAADAIDAADAARTAWTLLRWPAIALLAVTLVGLLYRYVPSARRPGRLVSLGAVAAVVLWAVATALFGVYVANFGSYNVTYGALAGVIVFLVWLWITNSALVFGLMLDAAPGADEPG